MGISDGTGVWKDIHRYRSPNSLMMSLKVRSRGSASLHWLPSMSAKSPEKSKVKQTHTKRKGRKGEKEGGKEGGRKEGRKGGGREGRKTIGLFML